VKKEKEQMIRLGTITRREPVEVLDRAVGYFGPQGLGLAISRRSSDSVYFEGAGGFVQIDVKTLEDGKTDVDIQAQEWDYDAGKFLTIL
jgi:hypothetical protein